MVVEKMDKELQALKLEIEQSHQETLKIIAEGKAMQAELEQAIVKVDKMTEQVAAMNTDTRAMTKQVHEAIEMLRDESERG